MNKKTHEMIHSLEKNRTDEMKNNRTFQDMVGDSVFMVFSHMREWATVVRLRGKTVNHNCACYMSETTQLEPQGSYLNFVSDVYYVFVDDVLAGQTTARSQSEHETISQQYLRTVYGRN